jgi:hypothetical protein
MQQDGGCFAGLVSNVSFHVRMLLGNPWKYNQWRADEKAARARDNWQSIHAKLQSEIDGNARGVEAKTRQAAQFMRSGHREHAIRCLQERHRLRECIKTRTTQQHKAELFMQQIDGKELELEMFEATKQSVGIMNRNNNPKQVKRLEAMLGEMQTTMDVASDFRSVFSEELDSGTGIMDDESLMSELENELAQECDSQMAKVDSGLPISTHAHAPHRASSAGGVFAPSGSPPGPHDAVLGIRNAMQTPPAVQATAPDQGAAEEAESETAAFQQLVLVASRNAAADDDITYSRA